MRIVSSLHVKLLSGFVLVLGPLVYLLYLNNSQAIDSIRDKVARTSYASLYQYTKQTDEALEESFTYLAKLETDSELNRLTISKNKLEYPLAKFNVFTKLNNDIDFLPLIDGLFVYIPEESELLLGADRDFYRFSRTIRQHIDRLLEVSDQDHRWHVFRSGEGSALYSLHRLSGNMVAGAWIDLDRLLTKVGFQNEYTFSQAVITDPYGNPLTRTSLNANTLRLAVSTHGQEGRYVVMEEPESKMKYVIIRSQSEKSALHYYIMISDEQMLSHIRYFSKIARLLPLFVILLLIWYSVIFYKVVYNPIRLMVTAMRRLGGGRLETRIKRSSTYEFNILSDSFNIMASQIEHLKIEVYEEQLRVKQTEFKHLQAQINPHFYLNTLNIIYSLAELREYKLIQKTTQHLVQYFRYITQTGRSEVALTEELSQVANYLEIQAMRLPDLFHYTIEVPRAMASIPVPPLLVQTFVENCMKHGFDIGRDKFSIRIAGMVEPVSDGRICRIVISDSGAGFSDNLLRELNGDEYWQRKDDAQLGLRNSWRRLKMKYGERADLRFSNEGGGATVCIEIREAHDESDSHKSAG